MESSSGFIFLASSSLVQKLCADSQILMFICQLFCTWCLKPISKTENIFEMSTFGNASCFGIMYHSLSLYISSRSLAHQFSQLPILSMNRQDIAFFISSCGQIYLQRSCGSGINANIFVTEILKDIYCLSNWLLVQLHHTKLAETPLVILSPSCFAQHVNTEAIKNIFVQK